ncbi:hypothetical protein CPter91_3628 [Collimonas pratensis]|uniref:Uncharacterized protein n=1 Tax=Collimonas pratensis TaxID=279113 RepID=A0A127Q7B1_9BURK|nr:hypothetical protein CPter91_3628 [Collimonas pratensis]
MVHWERGIAPTCKLLIADAEPEHVTEILKRAAKAPTESGRL